MDLQIKVDQQMRWNKVDQQMRWNKVDQQMKWNKVDQQMRWDKVDKLTKVEQLVKVNQVDQWTKVGDGREQTDSRQKGDSSALMSKHPIEGRLCEACYLQEGDEKPAEDTACGEQN